MCTTQSSLQDEQIDADHEAQWEPLVNDTRDGNASRLCGLVRFGNASTVISSKGEYIGMMVPPNGLVVLGNEYMPT